MEPTQEMKRPAAEGHEGTFEQLASEAHARVFEVAERVAKKRPEDGLSELDEFRLAVAVALQLDGLSVRQAHQVLKLATGLVNQHSGFDGQLMQAITAQQIAAAQEPLAAAAQSPAPLRG